MEYTEEIQNLAHEFMIAKQKVGNLHDELLQEMQLQLDIKTKYQFAIVNQVIKERTITPHIWVNAMVGYKPVTKITPTISMVRTVVDVLEPECQVWTVGGKKPRIVKISDLCDEFGRTLLTW